MSRLIVAVRDRALDAFGTPVFCVALGEAIRSFGDQVNSDQSQFNAHPEDYDLYHIGEFDERTGRMLPLDDPRMIAVGKDLLKSPS